MRYVTESYYLIDYLFLIMLFLILLLFCRDDEVNV